MAFLAAGFQPLGNETFLYESPNDRTPKASHPDIVLLLSWVNAQSRHIIRYTAAYQALFPSVKILVIKTSMWDFFRSQTFNIERIKGAVDHLLTLPAQPRILLHVFSNGGTIAAALCALYYRKQTGSPLPVRAIILDSAPGTMSYLGSVKALSAGLPTSLVIKALGYAFIYLLLVPAFAVRRLFMKSDPLSIAVVQLNNKSLFNGMAPRVYIFSKQDVIVHYKDVLLHATAAEEEGWIVDREEVKGTNHVSHMAADPDRYWSIVTRVWRQRYEKLS